MTAPTPTALDALLERLLTTSTARTWDSVGRSYDYPAHLPKEAYGAISALRAQVEMLTADLAEARLAAGLGCDATNGGAHSIVTDGRGYQFCHRCGETVRTPKLSERARQAEARALSSEAARAAAEADRDQWREAHTREYEARIATEIEQSAAVSARAAAEAALARATAQVTVLTEAHSAASAMNRSAWEIAERNGAETNWEAFRKCLMHALETSHEALNLLNPRAALEQKP